MKLTYVKAITLFGLLWGFIGYKLMMKGLHYFNELHGLEKFTENELGLFVGGCLLAGFIKGKFVLSKSADRLIRHIVSFEEPLKFRKIIPRSFLILMSLMMALGQLMKFLPIPIIFKGSLDLTVGCALIIGAIHFFKKACLIKISLKNI